VVVPGPAGERPVEVVQEPRASTPPPPPARRRWGLGLLAVVLVLSGASAVVDRLDRPEPARAVPSPFAGVRATARVLAQDPLQVRLLVEVRIQAEPADTGLPGSGASAAQVRLGGVISPGLAVRLGDRPPVLLGYVGRFGSGVEQVVRLTVDVVALGCVEREQPRRLFLSLTRTSATSDDVSATVQVQDSAQVAAALDELVRRSCTSAGSS
jgi:hypothetical protein